MGVPHKHKRIMVGDKYKTNYWGEVEVLNADDQKHIVVKFVNTGNEQEVRKSDLIAGNIKDREAHKAGVKMVGYVNHMQTEESKLKLGERYKSNLYGPIEIVEYINSKNVLVKFLNTGNIYNVQKVNILDGQIQDTLEKKRLQTGKAIEEKRRKEEREEAERLRKISKQQEVERKVKEKQEKLRIKASRRLAEQNRLVGRTYTDNLGHEFEVISSGGGGSKLWTIKYKGTGNTYTVKEGLMLRGSVYDKDRSDFEAIMGEYVRKKSTEWYDSNRERVIEQTSTYQKVNADRTRVRNRNRRARRLNAEGSHTLEETLQLLKDQNYLCKCCSCDISVDRHLDHIMPLALGGSNYIENLQWLCPFCNISKNDKHPDEWANYIKTEAFQSRLLLRKI